VRHLKVGLSVGLAAGCIFSLSCAVTSIRSQTNAQAAARGYRRLMVFVKVKDLGLRQEAEREFQTSFSGHEAQIVSSLSLFLPGQAHSKDEAHKVLSDAGIDAVLVIVPAGHGTATNYVPETTTIREHRDGRTTIVTTGGYTEQGEHWAKFDAALHDRSSRQVVWVATMSTEGLLYASWGDIVKSMAKRTSEQMVQDGIVR